MATLTAYLNALRHKIAADGSSLLAAGVAFYAALATIPALILTVSFYGLFTDPDQAQRHVDLMLRVLPASTVEAIEAQIHPLADFSHFHLSLGLVISVVAILWTVSNASRAIVRAVVIAYDQDEMRSPLEARLASIGIAILVVVFGTIAVAVIAAIPVWLTIVDPDHVLVNFSNLRWVLLVLVAFGGAAVLYRAAPPRRPRSWREVLPGALLATGLWMLISFGFAIYVGGFASYNATYGALAAGAVLLLWFWLTASIVILGAQFNVIRVVHSGNLPGANTTIEEG